MPVESNNITGTMNGSKHSFYGTQTAPIKQFIEGKSRSGKASDNLSKGSK